MNLTSEQRAAGQETYYEMLGVSRRQFLTEVVGAGAVSGAGLGAMYFDYDKELKDPVRVGIIGTGDEGNVLIGGCNPKYVQVVAIADIRPYNVYRAFHGDWASPAAQAARPGLLKQYGWANRAEAEKTVKVYSDDYHDLLNDSNVEAVIIALPLHLHAKVAVEAMQAGKHVLTEKLMAHNVAQCKVMGRVAAAKDMVLAVGHQRHYSILYDNAVQLLRLGVLGQLHHIRAQWHRGNLPGNDSWQMPLPGGEIPRGGGDPIDRIRDEIAEMEEKVRKERDPARIDLLEKRLAQWKAWDSDRELDPRDYGYEDFTLADGSKYTAMAELCRWRLWNRTGGGLMAELGSHQLDAASIFCSALRQDGKKAHPLSVHAVGGRHVFPLDRQVEDHVYCTFEFPGPEYDPKFEVGYSDPVTSYPDNGVPGYGSDPNKKIVVTYSSINGNGYGGYGEIVMGTKGTLILEREKDVILFTDFSASQVAAKADGGGPSLDTQASGAAPVAKAAESAGPVSRGYTEEIEHWAWCIRNREQDREKIKPRCNPTVALGDAVIALTSNVAIRNSIEGKPGYVQFQEEWYDVDHDATPDGSDVAAETKRLSS